MSDTKQITLNAEMRKLIVCSLELSENLDLETTFKAWLAMQPDLEALPFRASMSKFNKKRLEHGRSALPDKSLGQ